MTNKKINFALKIICIALFSYVFIPSIAVAQEQTATANAEIFFSLTTTKSTSSSQSSYLLVSPQSIIYLKFDLRNITGIYNKAELHIPIRIKSKGVIQIRQSNKIRLASATRWQNRPRLKANSILETLITKNQHELIVNLNSVVSEAGVYNFAILGLRNSRVLVRSASQKTSPKIKIYLADPTVTPTPTATPIPIQNGINLTRGPYLQKASATSIVLRWSSDVATNSTVYYGTTLESLNSIASNSVVNTSHRVEISGLSPNSKYYYRVGTSSGTLMPVDNAMFFQTSPAKDVNKATRIWVIGDSGTADANARTVRDSYVNFTGTRQTDLWLTLGDNAYNSGQDLEYQNALFDIYPNILKNTVLWPTYGNHDALSSDAATQSGPYYDIFSLPRNAEAGGIASGTEAYYSFDYGQIHFVCLDSAQSSRLAGSPMLIWLESDLAASMNTAHWIIAFFHHPPYSKGGHDSDSETELVEIRQNVLPILENHGVDLVLSGHSHAYERSYFIDGYYGLSADFNDSYKKSLGGGNSQSGGAYSKSLFTANSGTVYVVAGNSARITAGSLNHPVMYKSLLELGSFVLDIDGNRLDAKFLNSLGEIDDTFSIQK